MGRFHRKGAASHLAGGLWKPLTADQFSPRWSRQFVPLAVKERSRETVPGNNQLIISDYGHSPIQNWNLRVQLGGSSDRGVTPLYTPLASTHMKRRFVVPALSGDVQRRTAAHSFDRYEYNDANNELVWGAMHSSMGFSGIE